MTASMRDQMFEQNTPEWLAMRKNYIGASDAAPILGMSPYKTELQLWEEKLDLTPPQTTTRNMQRGHDLEDTARQELEKMTGLFFLPQVKFHTSIPYLMASLDGIDAENKYIAEIKCPNKIDHEIALAGEVPQKYIPQLQHQLEVCELEMGYYFSFNGSQGALVKIFRDDKFIKKMLEKEKRFWECVQSFTAPEMTERDYESRSDEFWSLAASEWCQINEQMKALESKEKKIRDALISMCNKKNSVGAGIKITRSMRKGNVDYSAIPELKEIEIERYRKNPIECYKISCT